MIKYAKPNHPIHELLSHRWSPYGFSDRKVSTEDLRALFEAARWAPSSYNEQPWRYIVATQDHPDMFQKVLDCLWELNQNWASHAPVLALGIVSLNLARSGKPNAAAQHDLGLASGNLSLEATTRGLLVHQMIGINPDKVRETFHVPEDFQPLTALAIGYAGTPSELSNEILERDNLARARLPLEAFVFSEDWGQASKLVT
jgi:nitroreductase